VTGTAGGPILYDRLPYFLQAGAAGMFGTLIDEGNMAGGSAGGSAASGGSASSISTESTLSGVYSESTHIIDNAQHAEYQLSQLLC